jgi:putative tryptophan/tyrosine transport system substrate-binding protein
MTKKMILFALCSLLLAPFSAVEAQELKKIPRVGVLVAGHPPTRPSLEGFRQGLRELGYIEHKNIVLELRWDEGKPDPWSELAADLVRLKVDVILAGHTVAALGAKQATSTIPIVIGATGGDPVADGLVASLARPGGNVTGLSFVGTELSPKRLELLKESIPRLSRAAVIWHPPSARNDEIERQDIKVTAESLRVKLQSLAVRDRDDFDAAFHAARQEKAAAVLISQGAFFGTHRAHIADLGIKYRLPTIAGEADFAESGGLMFYGQNIPDTWRRAASYVDKILKGTKPTDLPVERPTKFELIINLKTANQIGLTIPPNVLARADKVFR